MPFTMPALPKIILLAAMLVSVWPVAARADRKTVCTITVNSPDEKETFRRRLPSDQFQFVELVEHGRPDWLASARISEPPSSRTIAWRSSTAAS